MGIATHRRRAASTNGSVQLTLVKSSQSYVRPPPWRKVSMMLAGGGLPLVIIRDFLDVLAGAEVARQAAAFAVINHKRVIAIEPVIADEIRIFVGPTR